MICNEIVLSNYLELSIEYQQRMGKDSNWKFCSIKLLSPITMFEVPLTVLVFPFMLFIFPFTLFSEPFNKF